MTNNKLVLASFIAFAMLAMVATTIVTQETYAVKYRIGAFCGSNWQGSFHLSAGDPSLSIPPGCTPDNTETLSTH
ncbi:MAG: hypothetical protein WA323_05440 [Candidatus Nitrosopolaris sp.]